MAKKAKADADKKAEGQAPEDASGEAKTRKGGGKLTTMLLSAGLVVGGAAAGKFLLGGGTTTIVTTAPAESSGKGAAKGGHGEEGEGVEHGEVVQLPDLTVNLADEAEQHYLKVGISLVLAKGVHAEEFKAEAPKGSDVAVRYFSAKTYADLQKKGSIVVTKEELAKLMQETYGEEVVAGLLITSFLMQ